MKRFLTCKFYDKVIFYQSPQIYEMILSSQIPILCADILFGIGREVRYWTITKGMLILLIFLHFDSRFLIWMVDYGRIACV